MKHVEACYMPEMIYKAVFTALEALCVVGACLCAGKTW